MANAISISKCRSEWTGRLNRLGSQYAVVIHLVEVVGKRWAYLAGELDSETPLLMAARVSLTDRIAAVLYTEQPVTQAVRHAIQQSLRQALEKSPEHD